MLSTFAFNFNLRHYNAGTQTGTGSGGAVAFYGRGDVRRCRFESNTGFEGAALYVKGATVHVTDSSFKDNAANTAGGC
jgi:hypothetical protein